MKKILSTVLALAMAASVSSVAFAAENDSTITVNGRKLVFFEEQAPVIQNDRLYVPVRRVLETMGEKVSWDDATKTVTVDSLDNLTRVTLTIDNKEVSKYTFTSVLSADKEVIESDVAPVIINDRTMLPIRVIAEALGSKVDWNAETSATTIVTKEALALAEKNGVDTKAADFDAADIEKDNVPKLSISSDATDVKEGDIVTVKVTVKDLDKLAEGSKFVSATVGIEYNMDNFEYSGYKQVIEGKEVAPFTGADNGTFYNDCAKIVFINDANKALTLGEDGVFAEITFTALNDNGGDFKLSRGISKIGNNTEIIGTIDAENHYVSISDFDKLYIDQSVITVK